MSNFTRQPGQLKITIRVHIAALGEHTHDQYVRPLEPQHNIINVYNPSGRLCRSWHKQCTTPLWSCALLCLHGYKTNKRDFRDSAQFKAAVIFTHSWYHSRITLRLVYIQMTNTKKSVLVNDFKVNNQHNWSRGSSTYVYWHRQRVKHWGVGLANGRTTITDLIRARESEAALLVSEAALHKQLMDERQQEAICLEELIQTSRIVADKELESNPYVDFPAPVPTQLSSRFTSRSKTPWLFFLRSPDTSGWESTPDRFQDVQWPQSCMSFSMSHDDLGHILLK